jgi:hypothetical protein
MPAKTCFALLLLPFFALATGCGSSTGSSMTTTQNPYAFSGDWGATTTVNPTSVPIIAFLGTLSSSGGVVTGAVTPVPSLAIGTPCANVNVTATPVSGSIDANGNLTITLPVGGGTATLAATLTTNPETQVSGTYKIVGGTCAMSSTPMLAALYAPVNGTYSGTFNILGAGGTITPGTATTVTAVLIQSTTPNSSGQFPVAGNVTLAGACSGTFTLSDSVIWGGTLLANDTGGTYILAGGFDPTASSADSFFVRENNSGTSCPYTNQQIFDGTLTRQ